MKTKLMLHMRIWFSVLLTGVTVLNIAEVYAGACRDVPNCVEQNVGSVHYKPLQTKTWAYYCTGSHPYYWNSDSILGFGNNWSRSPSCFSVIENPLSESTDHPSKADFTITNWCEKEHSFLGIKYKYFADADISFTLGCSQVPQEAALQCSSGDLVESKNPKCPLTGKVQTSCDDEGICIQTWTEKCSNNKKYYCTDDSGVDYCMSCPD